MNTSMIEVIVVIAVSEDGNVRVSPSNDNNLIEAAEHKKWFQSLKEDKKLWSVKTIKTFVALPFQFEDQTK